MNGIPALSFQTRTKSQSHAQPSFWPIVWIRTVAVARAVFLFFKALLWPSSVFHFQISETWQLCTHGLPPWHILQRHERDWTADKMRTFTGCKRLRWEVLCAIEKKWPDSINSSTLITIHLQQAPPLVVPGPMLHYLWHTHLHTNTHTHNNTMKRSWEMVNTPAIPCCQWKPAKQWRHCSSRTRL